MKTLQRSIFLLGLIIFSTVSYAHDITVVTNNGDWENPLTWDLNRVPTDGDEVKIPAGMTVLISTNVYYTVPTQPTMNIKVSGIMQMVASGQINIGCASSICVFGSGIIPSTGCNCNQINLGSGLSEWLGQENSSITGGNCVSGCSPLPVQLLSFNGAFENGSVNLSWTTAEEVNFDHYEIERSSNGTDFITIGSVGTSENSADNLNYAFTDHQPANNISYYRLKEVDSDASFNYSNIIAVVSESLFSINVYPNPLRSADELNIVISAAFASLEEVSIVFIDQVGREYFSKSVLFENGSSLIIEDLNELSPGIYMLVASGSNKFFSKKVVVE